MAGHRPGMPPSELGTGRVPADPRRFARARVPEHAPARASPTLPGMQVRSATPHQLGEGLWQLIAGIEQEQGAPPFGEIQLAAMREGNHGSLGLVAERKGEPAAYGFAVPGPDGGIWILELAAGAGIYGWFLERALERLEAAGAEEAVLWVHSESVEPPLQLVRPDRALYRMSAALSLTDPPVPPSGVTIRGMDVRRDSSALIALNNRAFREHPEQGGWTRRDLETRLALDWFNPAGVRTAWIGSRLVAFNWTKVHPDPGPSGETVGEIYSIAVDPSFQGRGLGRTIAVEGLRYLAAEGCAARAILYVDSSNTAALDLYRSLGFATEHVDRAYRWRADR